LSGASIAFSSCFLLRAESEQQNIKREKVMLASETRTKLFVALWENIYLQLNLSSVY
jgi:hypothetical protein